MPNSTAPAAAGGLPSNVIPSPMHRMVKANSSPTGRVRPGMDWRYRSRQSSAQSSHRVKYRVGSIQFRSHGRDKMPKSPHRRTGRASIDLMAICRSYLPRVASPPGCPPVAVGLFSVDVEGVVPDFIIEPCPLVGVPFPESDALLMAGRPAGMHAAAVITHVLRRIGSADSFGAWADSILSV